MQVADVSKPLMSVRKMKEAGHLVVFGLSADLAIINNKTKEILCEGGEDVILNKRSKVKTGIIDTGKEYVMKTWVRKPDETFHGQP